MSDTDNKSSVGKIKGILQVIIAALIIVVAAFAVYLLLGPGKTKNPEKADILLEAGMHCLGCPASQMETLEEACEVHGIDVEEVLSKLNA